MHQQQNVNQAAQEWTEAVRQSFQTLADRTVTLQESNLKLTQNFFQQFVEQLQGLTTQGNQQALEKLQQQAVETTAQVSANAYADYLNSALSFYQQTLQQATQVAQSNLQTASLVAQSSAQATSQAAQQVTRAATQAAQEGAQVAAQIAQGSSSTAVQAAQAARAAYQDTQAGQAAWQAAQAGREAARAVLKGRRSLLEISGSGEMEDREAQRLALDAVRRARAETERVVDAPAPSPEEVRARRAGLASNT